jgi:hypothetical protein
MGWAIALEGRTDQAAILLLFDDRREAEDIAWEICRRGHPVVVRPYPDRGLARPLSGAASTPGTLGD